MTEQDKPQFATALFGLAELLNGKLTDAGLEMYFQALKRFPLAQVEAAANQLVLTMKFFPKPVEFIEAIEGAPDDRAAKAWDLFVAAVRLGGSWKSVYAEDGALLLTVQVVYGSWLKACEMLPAVADPMFTAHRKQFIASYSTAPAKGVHYLMGASEANNRQAPKLLPAGQQTFTASVVHIGATVALRECEFSAATGALTESSVRQLQTGHHLRLLAA